MAEGVNYQKRVPTSKQYGFLPAGTSNMEGPTKYGMAPTLQQHLFSLDHVMCTEAQQIYHPGCDHGC